MAESDELSSPDRRTWVGDSPGETLPCTLMAPGICKIRRVSNVLQVPIQIIPLGVQREGAIPSATDQNDGMSPDHPKDVIAHFVALARL